MSVVCAPHQTGFVSFYAFKIIFFSKYLERTNVVPYLKLENVNMYMPFIVKVISDVNVMNFFLRNFQTKSIFEFFFGTRRNKEYKYFK